MADAKQPIESTLYRSGVSWYEEMRFRHPGKYPEWKEQTDEIRATWGRVAEMLKAPLS